MMQMLKRQLKKTETLGDDGTYFLYEKVEQKPVIRVMVEAQSDEICHEMY